MLIRKPDDPLEVDILPELVQLNRNPHIYQSTVALHMLGGWAMQNTSLSAKL